MDFEEQIYGLDEHGNRKLGSLFSQKSGNALSQVSQASYIPNFYKSLIFGFNMRFNKFVDKVEDLSDYSKFSNGSLRQQSSFEFSFRFIIDEGVTPECAFPFLDLFDSSSIELFQNLKIALDEDEEFVLEKIFTM